MVYRHFSTYIDFKKKVRKQAGWPLSREEHAKIDLQRPIFPAKFAAFISLGLALNCATGDPNEIAFAYSESFIATFTLWSAVSLVVCAFLSWKLWNRLPVSMARLEVLFPLLTLFSLAALFFRPSSDDPTIVIGANELCIHTAAATRRVEYKTISSIERMYSTSRSRNSAILRMKLTNGQTKEWPLPDLWATYEPQISIALNEHGIRLIKYRDDKVELHQP